MSKRQERGDVLRKNGDVAFFCRLRTHAHHPWRILHRALIYTSAATSTNPHWKDRATAFLLAILNHGSRLTRCALDGRRTWSHTRHCPFKALPSTIYAIAIKTVTTNVTAVVIHEKKTSQTLVGIEARGKLGKESCKSIRPHVPTGLVIMAGQRWINAAFASILRRNDRIRVRACA
jgi:hypothetical protein